MIAHLPKQVSSGRVIAAVLAPRRRHSLLRLPRRCALTSRHDPAAICFGRGFLWSSDQSCGGDVRNPAPSRECTHPRRLAVLCFSRPLKNCTHLTPFCAGCFLQGNPRTSRHSSRSAPGPSTSARGKSSTVRYTPNQHGLASDPQEHSCHGPAGLEHIASRSCGEA